MWVAEYQRKEPQKFCAEWFGGIMSYHIWSHRNPRIHGEVKTKEIIVKRLGKDVKFRMMFNENQL